MAQSLSATTGSEIEHVTRLCQRLEFFVEQPPIQVRALSHGASNQSYYVKTAQSEYVLRCYPAESTVCRQQELRCQHAAAAMGLAATPLCLNNHYQVMLSEYIRGAEPFDYARHGANALLSVLAQFHQLQVQTATLDYSTYLPQLLAALPADTRVNKALLAALRQAAQQLSSLEPDLVLCHLDLHQGNLLWAADALWLLDFEYSQQADSSLDLAAISLHFNLDKTAEAQMLAGYARLRQRNELDALSTKKLPAEKLLAEKLPAAKLLYSGFCWLWYLALPDCQTQANYWQQQVQALAALPLQTT
ncbi:Phosphotransferase enzyme family protein [Rheinheimera pacifica]|uniref:Phosphotransferase enzyme family protein n=1 Tax=Rheinheimera pacifica TaxID=173990 RepID=A0A1H6J5M7_9GAMM|nr:phosphotransferase [Rheinheimera pacifica]SEH57232.1 Phosphotransferase enzyme family protein [Rheinheimera pacifica]